MEIARGQVTDRPWGQTLGALGIRGLTGQLTLYADDGKQFRIAFERGAIVGAMSPLTSDSAARVALTNHLITSSQVTQVARAVASHPDQDELDVLASACRLDPDRALRLRQRVIAQRAARTFSVETGAFVVTESVSIPAVREAAVDVRAVIYLGVRMNLSEQRLASDLRELGSYFTLKPDTAGDLPQFGFTGNEQPILEALRRGTTLPQLEARHRELDPRSVQAVIYSLVSCLACEVAGELDERPTSEMTPSMTAAIDGAIGKRETTNPAVDWYAQGTPAEQQRTPTGQPLRFSRTTTPGHPAMARTTRTDTQPVIPRTDTPRSTRVYGEPTPRIEPTRTRTLDNADRPVMFSRTLSTQGVDASPPPGRTPTPSQHPPISTEEPTSRSRPWPSRPPTTSSGRALTPTPRPFATRPPTTQPPLSRTTTASPTAAPASGVPLATTTDSSYSGQFPRISDVEEPSSSRNLFPSAEVVHTGEDDPLAVAAESYRRGNAALRDDQVQLAIEELTKAAALNPHNFDYSAMLAWAQFCGADDRSKIADKVRKMLNYAIQKSTNPELARFYLGRMERMLGRYREALAHFKLVLDVEPRNADAQAEIRQIEARLAAGSGEKTGLGGLFGRKKDR